ncbi:acyl-CoA reductase [Bradymonas sediminis]|uniref:Uncharacterized protein n=1 Tax=Bradymonas sediminis TaxID=1548548 RepID=A0A2Z4FPL6_9DELT|nr:acyl-CoA reductase [Bradymonas sediminis]AWV90939.1 hypothetical protein DN745_17050 [Bradymonas sediminis]TDP75324.1 acyl-CoA reductase LuxC [Bradymonas sediminis]
MPRADLQQASQQRASYAQRVELLRAFMAQIFDDIESSDREFAKLCEAVVRDGWPAEMARQGMLFGQKTWQIDVITGAFEAEMMCFGGVAALEGASGSHRITRPESVVHIWPALPGAGLTPVFYGALLGAPQWIRPSRRGRHFAEYIAQRWPQEAAPLGLLASGDAWDFADITVVSGSDETVAEVRDIVAKSGAGRRKIVTGYGHRVSFCVLVDGPTMALGEWAKSVATDTVMWHQMGCFSPRAVLFVGAPERLAEFGELLGAAIAREESRLGATDMNAAELAQRAQARGVAEFRTEIWGDGIGWVERSDQPFRGERIAAHTVSLHPVASLDELPKMLDILPQHVQGVALAAPDAQFGAWADALCAAGATRICAPGRLQSPDGDWPHDGRPNTLDWVRATHLPGHTS